MIEKKTLVNLSTELKKSYLSYAVTTIINRALPDVRDGLKPVHRRILYAMHCMEKNDNNYKKSARVVGEVIGKYHPHGDTAVYESIVRMVQKFTLRYPLVNGQGNFGSIDGDTAAAMRYTEIKLTTLAKKMLLNIDDNTVDFIPNYDNSCLHPIVLPTQIPNLIINGTTGIAVGLSTNIPPHNICEIIDATILILRNENTTIDDILQIIKGPDFPTGGIIFKSNELKKAYTTGRGIIKIQAKVIEEFGEKKNIIVSELPYQVNKMSVINQINILVKNKKIDGINVIRDETDKEGMRIVIETKRLSNTNVILQNLFKKTQLKISYGINSVVIVKGKPKLLNIKELITCFIEHRVDVITKMTIFKITKTKEHLNILIGLILTLTNIITVIQIIQKVNTKKEARDYLLKVTFKANEQIQKLTSILKVDNYFKNNETTEKNSYRLTYTQINAILELKLHNLTNLENEKITSQLLENIEIIDEYEKILHNKKSMYFKIENELTNIKDAFKDLRRTDVIEDIASTTDKELYEEKNVILILTTKNYLKIKLMENFSTQKRGGRGKYLTNKDEGSDIRNILSTTTHSTVLLFTTRGKVYSLDVLNLLYNFNLKSNKGQHIQALVPIQENEEITALLNHNNVINEVIVLVTKNGLIKKINTSSITKRKKINLSIIKLQENDTLISAKNINNVTQFVFITTNCGKVIKFKTSSIRTLGRNSAGIRAIRLGKNSYVVSALIVNENQKILIVTKNGYGKNTLVNLYKTTNRGCSGIIGIKLSANTDYVVGALCINNTICEEDILLLSNTGSLIKTPVNNIPDMGRNTKGVKLISLHNNEHVINIDID